MNEPFIEFNSPQKHAINTFRSIKRIIQSQKRMGKLPSIAMKTWRSKQQKTLLTAYKRLKTDSQNINILVKGGDIQPMGVVYGHIIWRYTLVTNKPKKRQW